MSDEREDDTWWICDRATFYERLAKRYEYNKPESPRRGAPVRPMNKLQASRGGKATKREYRAQKKIA